MKNTSILRIIPIVLLMVGCATTTHQTAQQSNAQSAIKSAEELGAAQVPEAKLHLQLAREQLIQANLLLKDGREERATWVLARAEADANLAKILAREANLRADAQRALDQVRQLQLQSR